MKEKMKKFGAWLLAAALAFAGTAAMAETVTVTLQEELIAAINAIPANGEGEIILNGGEFTLYHQGANTTGKSIAFIGQVDANGKPATIWNYGGTAKAKGEGSSDYSFDGSGTISFKNVIFKDAIVDDGSLNYCRGFVRAHGMAFENCTFKNMMGYFGDRDVLFRNCRFDVDSVYEYSMKAYSGKDFTFDGCTFMGNNRGYIQLFRESDTTRHAVTVRNCMFEAVADTSKTAVYFYDYNTLQGSCWDIAFEGENANVGNKIGANATSGTWLWGDMKYADAATTVVCDNGIVVWKDGKKVTPVVEDIKPVMPTASASVEVSAADGETEVVAEDKAAVEAVVTANEAVQATETGIGAATEGVEATAKYVSVILTAAKVAKTDSATVVKSMTFEVKPCAVTSDGVSVIPNEKITAPITVRFPVDAAVAVGTKADVTHNGVAMTGDFAVAGDDTAKYIEVASATFSTFAYTLIEGGEEPAAVAEVTDAAGKTTKFATLAEAFATVPWVDRPVNGCTVRLLADIDLAGVAWTPVDFCGTFDGNGKTISNLKVQVSSTYAGFFGKFRGEARDVTFEAADVTGGNYAAVFAANVSNAGGASDDNLKMLIEGVTIKNSTVKGVQKCGGVIGQFSQSNGSIEIRGCLVDTLSIGGVEGVWQAGGLVGHLQTGISEDAYIHDNTVRNITIADANVEYFKTQYTHQFFSSAFIGNVINYPFDGGAKDGTVVLEDNTVGGTNGGYQIGPKSNTYVGDYYTQDEVGGSISKVCKIEVDGVDITLVPNYVAEVFASDGTSVKKCESLAEAFATAAEQTGTAENPVVIQLMAGTIEEGTVKLPTTFKNVKMVGAANKATTIKNTRIMAHDGGPWDYQDLTFEGVVYDNSQFVFTGWRAGATCTAKNWAFIGNEFKDIVTATGSNLAALHLNFDVKEPLVNLTFEGNVIDGVRGSQCSGLYGIVSGTVIIRNNRIENCDYRAMNIMPATKDGIDDVVILEDNAFRGNYYEVLCMGNGADSTDNVSWMVRYNIFDDDETADTLDLYGTNPAKTTYVLDHNYYVKNPDEYPGKFYLNGACTADNIASFGVYPYYANYDKEALAEGASVRDVLKDLVELPVAQIVETGVKYPTLQAAIEDAAVGQTVKLLANVEECIVVAEGKDITLDLNGKMIDAKNVPNGSALKNLGKVTVTDSSEEKTGILARKDLGGNNVWYVINNEGEMVIDYANVTNICGTAYDSEHASLIENCGTLTIKDGYFSQPYPVVKNEPTGELTINGGTFTVAGMTVGKEVVQFYGTVEINGGSYDGTIKIEAGVDLEIKGGTFLGSDTVNKDLKRYGADGWYDVITDITSGGMMKHTFVKEIPEAPAAWLVANYAVPSYYCGDVVAANQAVKSWVADGYKSKDESEVLHLAVTPTSPKVIAEGVYHAVYEDGVEVGSAVTPATGIELKTTYDESTGVYTYEAVPSVGACIIKPNGEIVNYNVGSGSAVRNAATAAEAGDTVKVLQDDVSVTASASYFNNNANTPLTLDLNGKTIGRTAVSANKTISINKPITLTIVDGEGSGTVNQGVYVTVADGKAVIKGGIYKGTLYTSNGGQIIVQGGTFYNNPTAFVDQENYEVVDNGDGTWTVQEKAPPEVDVKDDSGDPEVKDAEGQPIPEEKKVAAEQKAADVKTEVTQTLAEPEVAKFEGTGVAEAATETKQAGEEHQIIEVKPEVVAKLQEEAEKKEETKDAKDQITKDSKVESRVEIVFNALEVKVDTAAEVVKATETSVQYEVTPKVKTTVTVEGQEPKVVEAVIPNSVIAGNPIKFRLAVDSTFGDFAKVLHTGAEDNFREEYLAEVFTANDASGKKFVELSSDHFSTFKLTSTSETPVCRVGDKNYTSLAEAIEKGGATAEIVLVANIELTEDVTLGYNQTIDPGEFAISGAGTVKAEDGYEVRIVNGKSVVYAKPTEVTVAGDQKIAVCIEPTVLAELGGAAALADTAANGFQVWQNYVMGVDGAVAGNKLVPICKPNAENPGAAAVTITTPMTFGAAPAKTGIAVTYQLLKSATPKSGFTMVGEEQPTPVFAVDTSAEENATYWKIQAIFTPDAN